MTKKMTKKEMFTAMLNKYDFTVEEVNFITHEIELLEKKSATGERKPTATQVANESLKVAILSYMAEQPNRLFTISELIKEVPELEGLSNQKVSAMMRILESAHKVEKVIEKRKSYFKLA